MPGPSYIEYLATSLRTGRMDGDAIASGGDPSCVFSYSPGGYSSRGWRWHRDLVYWTTMSRVYWPQKMTKRRRVEVLQRLYTSGETSAQMLMTSATSNTGRTLNCGDGGDGVHPPILPALLRCTSIRLSFCYFGNALLWWCTTWAADTPRGAS